MDRPAIRPATPSDRHVFTPREIAALTEEAARRRAILATTEKDAARLGAKAARVAALPVTLRFEEPQRIRELLRKALG